MKTIIAGQFLAALGLASHAAVESNPARTWMQEVTADVEGWRNRALLGLKRLKSSKLAAGDNVTAIGCCFACATVLQMAYADAPVQGAVSFRGSLSAAPEESNGKIGPRALVLHGYADEWIGSDIVANFRAKLEAADANWEMNSYGGVRHGITNPDAAAQVIGNLRYDENADQRSWARTQAFFSEMFDEPGEVSGALFYPYAD